MTQPTGTVTMLFTDIEASTRLLERLGRDRYAEALDLHRRLLRDAFARHDGYEVNCEGDSFFVAFSTAEAAVSAASEAQRSLATAAWPEGQEIRVRMGIHTGAPLVVPPDYVGLDVHRAARIMAAGHGGQVLLSQATRELLGSGTDVLDLGEHHLSDLSEPQRVHQLLIENLSATFPAPKTLDNRPTNLPAQSSAFIGRVQELQELGAILRRPETRLLTLTGPGGTGKTRLAMRVAAEVVEDFPGGVTMVALASVRDPALVLPTIAQTLDVREQGGVPLATTLADFVRDRPILLLLDNFEQVLPAALDVAALLREGYALKVLATSREPLHVNGEQEYPVPPLPEADAVALFVERARAVVPSFESDSHVAEICRRLDGLPLALQLAAARVKVLAPEAILARLEGRLSLLTHGSADLPERHQTLRATIEWSYDLLDDDAQRAFEVLAVFAGGFSLDAAEQVASVDLDLVAALVDRSLVRRDEQRYFFLETIREYAAERLDRRDDAEELRRRHAGFYLALAERAKPELDGPEQTVWLSALEREHANVREALAWALGRDEGALALRLTAAIGHFWFLRGYYGEGRLWLEQALVHAATPEARATSLLDAGTLAMWSGELDAAAAAYEEAIELRRDGSDSLELSKALGNLGIVREWRGEYGAARELFQECLALARAAEDEVGVAAATHNLGSIALETGDIVLAHSLYEESLARARKLSHAYGCAVTLEALGAVRFDSGNIDGAAAALAEALGLARELEDPLVTSGILETAAAVVAESGDPALGARLLGAAETFRTATQAPMAPSAAERMRGVDALVRGALDEGTWTSARAEGRTLGPDEAAAQALAVLGARGARREA